MEVFKCESCGWEVASTSFPSADVPRLEYELTPFDVRLGQQVSSAHDISVMRSLFPELAERSIADLKDRLRVGESLGIRSRREAERLQLEARSDGIVLIVEPANRTDSTEQTPG